MSHDFANAPVYLQDQQVSEAELTADEQAFLAAYMGHMRPQPVLMSRNNPTGRKLEELLKQLRDELQAKNDRLITDDSDVAQAVVVGNQRIMACLFEAEGVQRRVVAMLNCVGPDQGPLGRPRVGLGSPR